MVVVYKASTVNYAMINETAKGTVAPYQAGTVNHAKVNKTVKITDTTFVYYVQQAYQQYKQRQIKNYMFGQKYTMWNT